MGASSKLTGIVAIATLAWLGCGGGTSSKLDAAAGGGGGTTTGNGGARTGGTTGTRATGGTSGTGGKATGGSGGTGSGARDGGNDAVGGAGGVILDGGARDGARDGDLDSATNSDGAADRPDLRSDTPLDIPADNPGVDGGGLDAVAKDSPAADATDASPCGLCQGGLTCGGGGTPDRCGTVAALVPGKSCSPGGWCYESPRPSDNNLTAVYATTADDIWAVGFGGTIMHFDGTAWAGVSGLFDAAGTQISGSGDKFPGYNLVNFRAVWASGPADIWIVGSTGSGGTQTGSTEQPLLVHGDGTRWELVAVPDTTAKYFTGVSGSGPADVWIAGYGSNSVHHWNGSGWTATATPSSARYASGVWAASPTEAYLATQGGLFQWNGTTWTATTVTALVYGAWGSAAAGKWAWGSKLWHLIGTTWVDMGSAGSGPVWGTSETSLWQGNRYFDGTAWNTLPAPSGIAAVHGPKGSGAVGVGSNGGVFDLSPTAVTPAFASDPALTGTFWDIQSRGANDVWMVGRGTSATGTTVGRVVHWDGQAYTAHDTSAANAFASVGVGADGTILLGSANGPYTLSAGIFASSPGATGVPFNKIWVAGSDAAWAVGTNALIYFYDGATWKTVPHTLSAASVQLKDVWGIGPSDVWVAGTSGMTLHWDGAVWTPRATPSATAKLVGIWAADATHVWTIAEDGAMFAWDGTAWQAAPAFGGPLGGLHGCGPTELWAGAGSNGGPNVGRFDGAGWLTSITGVTRVNGWGRVWCAAPGDAWLVTASAVLRRVKAP